MEEEHVEEVPHRVDVQAYGRSESEPVRPDIEPIHVKASAFMCGGPMPWQGMTIEAAQRPFWGAFLGRRIPPISTFVSWSS